MRGEVRLGEWLTGVGTGWSPVCDPRQPGGDEWGVLKLSAVTSGRFIESEAKALPRAFTPRLALEVRPGDVLMARANGVRELVGVACTVGTVRPRLLLPDLVFRLTADPAVLHPEFLGIALASHAVRRQIDDVMRGSSGQYKVSQADVRDLRIPRLDVDEQERVVAAHAAFERRIGVLERALDKLKVARSGLAEAAIDGPDVVLGEVLAERPRNGYSPQEVSEWSGLQALGLGCLTDEGFVPKQLKNVPDTVMGRRYVLRDGDLLMSRANTRELVGLAGRYQDVGSPCIYPDLMMRLRPDAKRCLPSYLELVLRAPAMRRMVKAAARGTSESMVKISSEVVEGLTVPLPDRERQREIVRTVASLDRRIAARAEVIAKLRTVQQGVVEDLLAGRVRQAAA
ncbi:hypothetical protein [Streptomyces sp. HC307]|uniref:hypothetical protein n=1 Tax=Streptomyces flavusporus TaxID=3385496 RepID=UPI003917020C